MNKIKIFLMAGSALLVLTIAQAQNPFDISYPIPELGNCSSQEECKNFCDNPENHIACIEWGEKQGAFSSVESKRMKDLEQMENRPDDPVAGPGGCRSPKECDVYCRILENLDECLDYGVAHGYTSAEEAQKIKEQAQRGGPGGCKSREQCDSYCKNPDNIEECMKFVVDEGKISREEADLMIEMTKKGPEMGKPKGPKIDEQKAMQVLEEKGGGPGGCKSMEECRAYCENTGNMQECTNFAVSQGFMSPEEAEKAQKMMSMGGPGGCKNEQECDAFCGKEENRDICFNFAKENGMMSQEEIMMMEKQMSIVNKLGDKAGPGGCRSQEECGAYCSDPSKIQECMNFAAETGMMSKERAETMMQQMQKTEMMGEFFMGRTMMGPPPPGMEGPPSGGMPPPGMENMMPPEGMTMPPSGEMMGPPPGYEGPPPGYEGQMPPDGYQMPPEGWQPPEGMTMPPSGEMMGPPPGYEGTPPGGMPPDGYQMPPEGMSPPPPPPPSSWNTRSIMGVILGPFLDILR